MIMERCINLDWLECYCREPRALDEEYWRACGYSVAAREYGTPQYHDVLTLSLNARPFVEIRRRPLSIIDEGGIFPANACHIRMVNSALYTADPVGDFLRFLARHHVRIVSTSRLDVCLDFVRFDNGTDPALFLRDYFAGLYAKVNQCRFSAHGIDTWRARTFHSVKWGSEKSRLTTKMYCKTLELATTKDKPYIRAQWNAAGFPSDAEVWRIEFSMKSSCKSMMSTETGEMIDLSLQNIISRPDFMALFAALYETYFDFRHVLGLTRKDRCPRVPLFDFNVIEGTYKFVDIVMKPDPDRRARMMLKYLNEIIADAGKWGLEATWAADELREVFIKKFQFARPPSK